MKTGSSPFELTVAPGTILTMPLRVEVVSNTTGFMAYPDVKYETAAMPKGAWIDPADSTFKWHVRGADGDVFAFTIVANAKAPNTTTGDLDDVCVDVELRVRVKDDDDTRLAQVEDMAVDANAAWRSTYLDPGPTNPDWLKQAHDEACGAAMSKPSWRDADGDGLKDAIFVYPYRGGGEPNTSDVFLRRGDTFAKLPGTPGGVEYAADGTTFLVDLSSAGTGFSCSIGIKIAQVFGNRVSIVVDEPSNAPGEGAPECAPGDGMSVDHAGGAMIGFHDQYTPPTGAVTKRAWRWDGKRFAPK